MTNRPFPFRAASRWTALGAAAVALLFAAPLQAATPEYTSLAGVKAAGFQKWLDDAKDQGYQPFYINGYDVGDHAEFAGVAVKDPTKTPFAGRFDLTADEFQKWIDEMQDKGYRPRSLCGYRTKAGPRFAGAFIKDKWAATHPWKACHNQPEKDFEDTVTAMHKEGKEPVTVTAYQGADGAIRYTAVFVADGHTWQFRHDLTAEKYAELIDRWASQGFRPICVAAYDTPDGLRYLASGEAGEKETVQWQERHGMSGNKYQKEFDGMADQGYLPFCICGYFDGGESRFMAVWTKKK